MHAKPEGFLIELAAKLAAFKVSTLVFPLPGPAITTVLLSEV
jgi:hypothetical protein